MRARVGTVQNKKRIYELAEQHGVAATQTHEVPSKSEPGDQVRAVRLEIARPLADIVEDLRQAGVI